jgi:hypothetical protein
MSQNEKDISPATDGANPVKDNAATPPAQPAKNVPEGINPGAPVTVSPGVQLDNARPTPPVTTVPVEHPRAQGAAAAATQGASATQGGAAPQAPPAATPAPTLAPAQAAPPPPPAAPKTEETAVAKVNSYIPGGVTRDIINPVPNPAQSDQNFPFSAGQKMHEVAQYQNFFTFPLDTYYNIFDAINYFSAEKNRNRYTYDQQQLIISKIVRAAIDFGIPIEGVREKLMI